MVMFQKGFHRHGRRNTYPRNLILEFFENNKDKHFSAKEIYEELLNNNLYVGIASVYRNLELLSSLGYIKKYAFDNGGYRYQYIEENQSHQHIFCKDTGNIIDIQLPEDLKESLNKYKKELEKKYKIKIDNFELKFFCSKLEE